MNKNHIEISPVTAAIWSFQGVIWYVATGQERVWFKDEFGIEFYYEHQGFCFFPA